MHLEIRSFDKLCISSKYFYKYNFWGNNFSWLRIQIYTNFYIKLWLSCVLIFWSLFWNISPKRKILIKKFYVNFSLFIFYFFKDLRNILNKQFKKAFKHKYLHLAKLQVWTYCERLLSIGILEIWECRELYLEQHIFIRKSKLTQQKRWHQCGHALSQVIDV